MKDLAFKALDAVSRAEVSYADARAIEIRDREIGTKNGKVGQISGNESVGIGIRVLAEGCWGFAGTDDLTPHGIEAAASLARQIARSGILARKDGVELVPEEKYEATWVSPFRIDPFSVSIDEQLGVLL